MAAKSFVAIIGGGKLLMYAAGTSALGAAACRVVLVGWWQAAARQASARRGAAAVIHHNSVEIHPCGEADRLAGFFYSLQAGWMLAGLQLDDGEIHRIFARVKAVREDLSLALLGPRRDWRRCERWLRRGCRVYLEDTAELGRMAEAIRASQDLGINVTDSSFFQVLQERSAAPAPHLTQREQEVLDLLRRGLRNRDIAGALHVTENTVEYHMRHLLSKFGARSRLEVVERASALGLA
jgi:DNA-binding NarL/FixJ family response regulator